MTKTKKADKCTKAHKTIKTQICVFHRFDAKKNEDIAILSHSADSIVEDSQFWLTVPEILWATLYVFKKLLEIFFEFLKGQSLKILGGHK